MTVSNIPYEFIRQHVELGWPEIKFGLDQQLLKPKAAIDKATDLLSVADDVPKEVIELAGLGESEPVTELVSTLITKEVPPSDGQIKAKWLYLVLAWLFENRESLVDALGMVESVYSDFDYPKEIASFVRYMPLNELDLGNREQNEARMFERWKTYLGQAKTRIDYELNIVDIPHKGEKDSSGAKASPE